MDVQVSMPPPPPPPPPPGFFGEATTSQFTSPPPAPPPPQSVTTTMTTTTNEVTVANPSATQDRIWLHPWTVAEMREHASHWSLAGDAGVLLYLEQFSDKLTQRGDSILLHLNQTVNAVKSTHTRVLNCLNEFTSLANTQFIENRVYDEDETDSTGLSKKDEQTTDKTNVNTVEAQEKVLQRYVEAIQYGLSILDTHFERVEAKLDANQNGTVYDDDEDGGIPLEPILEPKDPYMDRPLPHLIGTPDFMEDDYVGLGELLNVQEEDDEVYDVEQIKRVESYSEGSSSGYEDEDDEINDKRDDDDFQAQISPAPIVPAGASRTAPSRTILPESDSDNDDDDPFGINKTVQKIDTFASKPIENEYTFDDQPKPVSKPKDDFDSGSEDDNENSFGIPAKPTLPTTNRNIPDDFDEKSSASSDESEKAPEPPKPKQMTELEKAVLRRRQAMNDPDAPPVIDDDDEIVKKPPKITNEPIKSKSEPSTSTIANLVTQPLSAPMNTNKPSIFEKEEEDDEDIFSSSPKQSTIKPLPTILDTKPVLPSVKVKEDNMFGSDSDEGDDLFSPNPKSALSALVPGKKVDPVPKVPAPIITKITAPISLDDSDEDDLFATKTKSKPVLVIPTPAPVRKTKQSSSDEEPFTSPPAPKQQPPATTSNDADPLNALKSTVPTKTPAVVPPIKKTTPIGEDEDSDDGMFGIKTKPSTIRTSNAPASRKPDSDEDDTFTKPTVLPTPIPKANQTSSSDEDDKLPIKPTVKAAVLPTTKKFDPLASSGDDDDSSKTKPPAIPKVSPAQPPKVKPLALSDEDEDDLFSKKPLKVNLPPPVVLPPLPSPPITKPTVVYDPLGLGETVETTSSPVPPPVVVQSVKTSPLSQTKKDSDSDSDDEDRSASKREINKGAPEDGKISSVRAMAGLLKNMPVNMMKPGGRPKPAAVVEEPREPSVDDDEQPVQNNEPVQSVATKISKPASDSDDDDLFKDTKKITPKAPVIEEKAKTNVKDISSRISINPMMPGAPPKPDNTSELTLKEEPVIDKTMISIARDRAKVAVKRTPPSRKPRSTEPTSTNENDDPFALPTTTTTSAPPPPPPVSTTAPVIPPPSVPTPAPIIPSPSVPAPVTETKSPVVPKPTTTTTKATAKPILPLLDDDDDFLLKRPVKKATKPVDNDDIFADVKTKNQPVNKAKKDWSIMGKGDETDDIFGNTPTKSSTTTKPKTTEAKTKPTKSFDLFDDPLGPPSKR